MDDDRLVVCETVAAVMPHFRELHDTERPNYHGNDGAALTLCGSRVGWDTKLPSSSVRCRKCLALAGRGVL